MNTIFIFFIPLRFVAQLIYSSCLLIFNQLKSNQCLYNRKNRNNIQMADQQFGEKAHRLFQRLSSISLHPKSYDSNLSHSSSFPYGHPSKCNNFNSENQQKLLDEDKPFQNTYVNQQTYKNVNFSNMPQSVMSQSGQLLNELIKYERKLCDNEQSNNKKISKVKERLVKFEDFLNEENQNRNKINQNFMNSALKIEKNMQMALSNLKKIYVQRQKKLEQKIQNIIKTEKKKIQDHIEQFNNIQEQIERFTEVIKQMEKELARMRKNRVELEDRIYKQFMDQVKNLKLVFDKNIKQREEKELKLLGQLKRVYKNQVQNIKNEEMTRQKSERLFLNIIQQLIDKISEA